MHRRHGVGSAAQHGVRVLDERAADGQVQKRLQLHAPEAADPESNLQTGTAVSKRTKHRLPTLRAVLYIHTDWEM